VSQPPASGDQGVAIGVPEAGARAELRSLVARRMDVRRRQVSEVRHSGAQSGEPAPEDGGHSVPDPVTWRWSWSRGCRRTASPGHHPHRWNLHGWSRHPASALMGVTSSISGGS
jgi:hypothetical protein